MLKKQVISFLSFFAKNILKCLIVINIKIAINLIADLSKFIINSEAINSEN